MILFSLKDVYVEQDNAAYVIGATVVTILTIAAGVTYLVVVLRCTVRQARLQTSIIDLT